MHECIRPEDAAALLARAEDDPTHARALACPNCRALLRSFEAFEKAEVAPGSRPDAARVTLGAELDRLAGSHAPHVRAPRHRGFRPSSLAIAVAAAVILVPSVWLLTSGEKTPFIDALDGSPTFVLFETPDTVLRSEDEIPVQTIEIGDQNSILLELRAPRGRNDAPVWELELSDSSGTSWVRSSVPTVQSGGKQVLQLAIDPARISAGRAQISLQEPAKPERVFRYDFELIRN